MKEDNKDGAWTATLGGYFHTYCLFCIGSYYWIMGKCHICDMIAVVNPASEVLLKRRLLIILVVYKVVYKVRVPGPYVRLTFNREIPTCDKYN